MPLHEGEWVLHAGSDTGGASSVSLGQQAGHGASRVSAPPLFCAAIPPQCTFALRPSPAPALLCAAVAPQRALQLGHAVQACQRAYAVHFRGAHSPGREACKRQRRAGDLHPREEPRGRGQWPQRTAIFWLAAVEWLLNLVIGARSCRDPWQAGRQSCRTPPPPRPPPTHPTPQDPGRPYSPAGLPAVATTRHAGTKNSGWPSTHQNKVGFGRSQRPGGSGQPLPHPRRRCYSSIQS